MLHEVLLALSGHPSPLFTNGISDQSPSERHSEDFPLLSPSEKALLHSIGQLSDLHRRLRKHAARIAAEHRSMICRAVATSIQYTHLKRFQKRILEVESKILTRDSSLVGAYDIVPLASVVGEFDEWPRRMAWFWEMACFMQAPQSHSVPISPKLSSCTGAAVIDKLREEQQTGFPDIEEAAMDLSKAAEMAWLRQLSSWVVYGLIPSTCTDDFFIQKEGGNVGAEDRFFKAKPLTPKFVSSATGSSILVIGKSLHQVRRYGKRVQSQSSADTPMSEGELTTTHLKHLSSLVFPILPAQLSRAITSIRQSLSQNILQHLLPLEMTLTVLACANEFFLLSRGDFAFVLIKEADSRLQARQQSRGKLLQQDPVKALQGLAIRDVEMKQALSQALKTLATQNLEDEDGVLDFARQHLTLEQPREKLSRPSSADSAHKALPELTPVVFHDLLFPTAAILNLTVPEPLDLFISTREIEIYSALNAYLLAIERAYTRLSELWKQTPARRDHPSRASSAENRVQSLKRRLATRKVWATCSAAIFLLSETARYLEGEIIKESWEHFERWIKEPEANQQQIGHDSTKPGSSAQPSHRDPETLSSGHRVYLAALVYALLFTDLAFTRDLRSLLGNVDNLVAFFTRLLDVQQRLDVERDAGGETGHTLSEEQAVSLELDRARKKVDSDLKSVVNRLRQLDHERIGSGRYLDVGPSESGFQPWKGGGVDRLLMKLEFGRMADAAV